MFYTRYEFAKRLSVFYGQSAVAGAVGGLLSYGVFSIFPASPTDPSAWRPWQVLFFIEGFLTIAIALSGFFFLPHSPETSWFFNEEEKKWAGERILFDRAAPASATPHKYDEQDHDDNDDPEQAANLLRRTSTAAASIRTHLSENPTTSTGLTSHDVLSALTSWQLWWLLICNILSAIPVSSFSVFLPLIVRGLTGTSPSSASLSNLLSVPPFITGAIVLFAFAIYSDRTQARLKPILYGLAILLAGLTGVVMLPHGSKNDPEKQHTYITLRYISLCIMVSGSFVASPLTVTWISTNTLSPGKRAIMLGINGWGNFAGVIGAQLFSPKYGPDYVLPFFITLGSVGLSFVGFGVFRNLVIAENAKRVRSTTQWTEEEVDAEQNEGLGPLVVDGDGLAGMFRRGVASLVAAVMKEGVDFVDDRVRRGDEKITFTYTL